MNIFWGLFFHFHCQYPYRYPRHFFAFSLWLYGLWHLIFFFAELYLNYLITVFAVGSDSKADGLGRHGARTSDGSAETDIQVETIPIHQSFLLVYLVCWSFLLVYLVCCSPLAQVGPLRGTSAPGCHALISTGSVSSLIWPRGPSGSLSV